MAIRNPKQKGIIIVVSAAIFAGAFWAIPSGKTSSRPSSVSCDFYQRMAFIARRCGQPSLANWSAGRAMDSYRAALDLEVLEGRVRRVDFRHPDGGKPSELAASIAQAFDETEKLKPLLIATDGTASLTHFYVWARHAPALERMLASMNETATNNASR